jgi:hypothetical protein
MPAPKSIVTLFFLTYLLIPAVAAENINSSTILQNPEYIGQTAHMPYVLWLILLGIAFVCFFASLFAKPEQCTDLCSALSFLLFSVLSITSFFVEIWSYETALAQLNETAAIIIQPVVYQLPGWIVLIMILMTLISVVNMYRIYLIQLEEASKMKFPQGDKPL